MHVLFSGHRCRAVLSLIAVLIVAGCGGTSGAAEGSPQTADEQEVDGTVGVVSEVVSPEADDGEAGDQGFVGDGQMQPGTTFDFGEPAILAVSSGGKRGVVAATVELEGGDPADLSELGLDADSDESLHPYYVTVTFENVGEVEMPYASLDNDFHGLLSDGSPAREHGTAQGFRPCETVPAPADFDEGKTFETCRVFLAPDGERVRTVVYEGFDTPYAEDPVTWGP